MTEEKNLIQRKEGKEDEPLSTLEKAAQMAERIEKASTEAVKAVERLEQLKADNLLAGTGGIRPEIKGKQEESPAEYSKRLISKPYGDVKHEAAD